MPSTSPDVGDVIRAALARFADRLNVAIPGVVESFDAARGAASVRPLVRPRRETDDGPIHRSLPVVPRVPVVYPSGGGFRVRWPLKQGDNVLLVACQAQVDDWFERGGGPIDARSSRAYSYSDAVAIPGVEAFTGGAGTDATDMTIDVPSGAEVRVGAPSADFVALAALVRSELDRLWGAMANHIHAALSTPAFQPMALGPIVPSTTGVSLSVEAASVAAAKLRSE